MSDELLSRLVRARSAAIADVAPDGSEVLLRCDLSGTMQLYRTPTDGGGLTQVTFLDEPVAVARYLPRTADIVLAVDSGGDENYQLWLVDVDGGPLRELLVEAGVKHDLGDVSADGSMVAFTSTSRNGVDLDVHVLSVADRHDRTVLEGGANSVETFSPDGRWLTVTRVDQELALSADLLLIDLDSGAVRRVVERSGPGWSHHPSWYPGSEAFLFSTDAGRDVLSIARYDLSDGRWEHVLGTGWDSEVSLSGDGRAAVVVHAEDGTTRMRLHGGRRLEPVSDLAIPPSSVAFDLPLVPGPRLSSNGGTALLTITAAALPPTPLVIDTGDGSATMLVPPDDAVPPELSITPDLHRVRSFDGEEISAFVYRPAVTNPPVVLFVHGGPESRFAPRYDPFILRLVSAGLAVVAPNVRGSTGWGRRFAALDDRRLRLDSVSDLCSIHGSLPGLGLDGGRVAVMGGSYGGYMALAALAFHPDLWAAGISIVGISSLVTFLENTSAYRRRYREVEYGFLQSDRAFLESASPLSRVDDITAPLMLIHGANDPRVPVGEARQLHASLTARGVPSELIVYADEGHGLAKRNNRLDAYPRMLEFLRRHLGV